MGGGPDQFELLEIGVVFCGPPAEDTNDLTMICRGVDGNDYAIKKNVEDRFHPLGVQLTPHNEYFCYRLGDLVGVASPVARRVTLPDGVWFGSRWEGGAISDWWERAIDGRLDPANLLPTLARVYAFDLFVNNIDRHASNYIVRDQFHGPSMLAYDYGHAWTYHGFPLPALPMHEEEQTVFVQRYLSTHLGQYVNEAAVAPVLDAIARVTVDNIERILDEQPAHWLPNATRDAILYWWNSDDRLARVNAIRTGLVDGTFL